ncbi:MAG: Fic family protein [Flavobacteriales bacterium]
MAGTSLPPNDAALLDYAAFLRGVLANATLDGNSLTEEQVDRLFEGSLELPPSQRYLQVEIENLVKAIRSTAAHAKAGDLDLSPLTIQLLHAQLLKGLPLVSGAAGEYRSTPSAGPAPEAITGAMDRLHEWSSSSILAPEQEEERMASGILRAVLAHVYLLWIEPFAEGNGRMARLAEHQLLLGAGVPAIAAHQITIQAAATRTAYARQLADSRNAGNVAPFITYQVRGFVDALRALWAEVEQIQHQALWQHHMGHLLRPEPEGQGARRLQLMSDLAGHRTPVPASRLSRLSPELARLYALLNPKTLQRDLAWLEAERLLVRTPNGFLARQDLLRPFAAAKPEAPKEVREQR